MQRAKGRDRRRLGHKLPLAVAEGKFRHSAHDSRQTAVPTPRGPNGHGMCQYARREGERGAWTGLGLWLRAENSANSLAAIRRWHRRS